MARTVSTDRPLWTPSQPRPPGGQRLQLPAAAARHLRM